MNLRTDNRGSTLVELVVVTALFAIVGGLSVAFFIATLTGRARALARIETQAQARFAMERMVYEIRRARGTEVTSDFGVDLATTPAATLDLDMEDVPRDPTSFSVSSGVLRLEQAAGGPVDLTTGDVTVDSLVFDDRSSANGLSKNIKVTLTVTHTDPNGGNVPISYTLRSAVELRDK